MGKTQEAQGAAEEKKGIGEVKIAADVVTLIAGLAANEVEGVYCTAGNVTNELIGKLGRKRLSKGVKVNMEDGAVRVDIIFHVKYGYSIPKVSKMVQDKVSQQIEMMTGLVVPEVNVRVAGVNLAE